MADIKWSAFPTVASPTSGDTLVGLHSGANYQFTGLTIPFSGAVGGTGVVNTGKTITLGGNLTTSGAFASTFTMTAATSVTFPTSGTLATTAQLAGAVLLAPSGAQTITGFGLTVPSLTTANLSFDATTNVIASLGTNSPIALVPNGTGGVCIGNTTSTHGTPGSLWIARNGFAPALGMSAYVASTSGCVDYFFKSRSTSQSSFATINTGDTIGSLLYFGDDGTQFSQVAGFVAQATGTVSTGIVPGQFLWSTTNASGVSTLGMTLTSAQILTLANPLPAGSGGTGVSSLGTGVATALGQNVTGSGGIVLTTSPTISSPIIDQINASAGVVNLDLRANASAVNYLQIANAATGDPVALVTLGSDTNVSMQFGCQGTGQYQFYTNATTNQVFFGTGTAFAHGTNFNFPATSATRTYTWPDANGTVTLLGNTSTGSGSVVLATSPTLVTPVLGAASATSIAFTSTSGVIGTTTNDSAAAGSVGELIAAQVIDGSPVTQVNVTATNICSISLTAGDWDVWANVNFSTGTATNLVNMYVWIGTASASLPPQSNLFTAWNFGASGLVTTGASYGLIAPQQRYSLSGTTTIYLSTYATYSVSTLVVTGFLYARRRR